MIICDECLMEFIELLKINKVIRKFVILRGITHDVTFLLLEDDKVASCVTYPHGDTLIFTDMEFLHGHWHRMELLDPDPHNLS